MSGSNSSSDGAKKGNGTDRRTALKHILGLPVLGGLSAGFGAGFCAPLAEERPLLAEEAKKAAEASGGDNANGTKNAQAVQPDATSGATRTSWDPPDTATLKAKIPHAKIGDLEISRLILGGNLIGGWAHSRDLVYVSELVKRYHTKEKVFETFQIAEACGINTFMGNPVMNKMLEEYWRWTDGKMQFISDCGGGGGSTMQDHVRAAIDFGCDACYLHGGMADRFAADKEFDTVAECLEIMHENGYPAGIGAHYQPTVDTFVAAGIIPDFWMTTFHEGNYWSASAATEHDNIFCREPNETRAFFESSETPWIAFKVLSAGAIAPDVGFRAALAAGADFLCVGMYDFQIINDCNLFHDVSQNLEGRKRRMLETVSPEAVG